MPRNVGSIEVTVEANTNRLKAQLVKAGHSGGAASAKAISSELKNIQAEIDLQTGDVQAATQVLRKQIEAKLSGIPIDIDLERAVDDIERLRAEAEAFDMTLKAVIRGELSKEDMAEIGADWKAVKAKLESDKLQLEIGAIVAESEVAREAERVQRELDTMEFEAEVEMIFTRAREQRAAFDRQQLLNRVGLETEADFSRAEREILGFVATHQDATIRAQLETDLNRAKIQADLGVLNAMVENYDFDANVEVRVDKASKAKADALIENNMRETGGRSGDAFASNFLSGDDTKLIIAAVLSMGDAIAAGLSGAVGAGTSVLSSGLTAIGGAAGAAAPLVASFGASLGAVVVGSQGVGEALGLINDEFAAAREEGREMSLGSEEILASLQELAPAARHTAEAFASIRDELARQQMGIQQRLFAGFSDVVRDLGATVLPDVAEGLGTVADSINRFGRQLATVAQDTDFSGLAVDLAPALDDSFDAATALVEVLEPFLRSAAKPAERLAEMFERGAEGMRDWVALNPDKITEFLDDGLTSLELWVELLKSTGDLLGTVIDAATESGDNFVVSLNNMIERWDALLENADDEAVAEFFEDGRAAMDAMKPVLDGLKEAFDVLVTDTTQDRFADLMDAIGDALPAIAEMISLIGELRLGEAFANLFALLEPVFNLLQLLPDEMMAVVGAGVLMTGVFLKINSALSKLDTAFGVFKRTNPLLLGLAGAAVVATTVIDNFGSKSDDAAAKTENLSRALEDAIDAAIATADTTNAAAIGVTALNDALAEGEDSGERIAAAYRLINDGAGEMQLGVKDNIEVLGALREEGEDSVAMLQRLAEGYGLPADEAQAFAEAVDGTDDEMHMADIRGSDLAKTMADLAKKTGLPEAEVRALFAALEDLQDVAEDTDLEAMQQAFIDSKEQGTLAEQAIVGVGTALQESGEIAAGVGPLYDYVVEQLALTGAAGDDAAAGILAGVSSYELVNQAIEDAIVAHEQQREALLNERQAAYDAWQEQEQLAAKTEDAAVAAADAYGFSEDLAQGFVDVGNAARDAADKASAFKSAIDLIIAPAATTEDAFIAVLESLEDFNTAMIGGKDAISKREDAIEKLADADRKSAEGREKLAEADREAAAGKDAAAEADRDAAADKEKQAAALRAEAAALQSEAKALEDGAKTLDVYTEAGKENIGILHDLAEEGFTWAAAALAQGESADDVIAKMTILRESMVQNADAAGKSREEAEAYIDTLLGTPEMLNTIISTPGMVDALLNAEDLSLLYDEAGNPVITEFEQLGLDPALATSEEFKSTLEALDLIEVAPTVDTSNVEPAQETVDTLQGAVDTINESSTEVDIAIPEGATVEEKLTIITNAINDLDVLVAEPTITIPFIDRNIERVRTLQTEINNLTGKTITVNVNSNLTGDALPFGIELPGGMAGAMITAPRLMRVGERGYREALVPLDLPLNRVDPSVRDLAAALRGGSALTLPPTKQVNNYMTVTPTAADPAAVATQIINRAAALASR